MAEIDDKDLFPNEEDIDVELASSDTLEEIQEEGEKYENSKDDY